RRETWNPGDAFEPENRLHSAPRMVARVRLSRDFESKALRGHVDRGPEPVVVGRDGLIRGEIAGNAKIRGGRQAPAIVTRFDPVDECPGLLLERHLRVRD